MEESEVKIDNKCQIPNHILFQMASKKLCEGIVLSSKKPCTFPAGANGFCSRHQAQVFLRDAKEKGDQTCRMFDRGCRNYLTAEDKASEFKTCAECRTVLSGKSKSCEREGCANKTEGIQRFCGKHARDIFREKEKAGIVSYCNIDRGCASILKPEEKQCEVCRCKKDIKVTAEIKELRDLVHNCLKCRSHKKEDGDFCKTCYPSMNIITNKNVKRELNNVWRDFKNGAIKRELELTVNFEAFKDIVVRPCFFCGEYSLSSYNGVDRYDNRKGYITSNCVPCCSMCNIMKGSTQPVEYYEKLQAILHYQTHSASRMTELLEKYPSYVTKSETSYSFYKKRVTTVREIGFELTKDHFQDLHKGSCYLCGINNSKDPENGIDRVESQKGYTVENCKTCCGHCNLMKSSYDLNIFIQKCKQIIAFWKPLAPLEGKATSAEPMYRAADIYEIRQRGIHEFLPWARKAGKSEQFMEGVRAIVATEKAEVIEMIGHQMELERKRTKSDDKKHIQASTMLAMLMNSPKSNFVELYSSIYELSNSFHTKLDELLGHLVIVGSEEGKELCKKFLRAENMRRKSKRNTDVCRELRDVPVRAEWTAKPLRNMVVCNPPKVVEVLTTVDEVVEAPTTVDEIKVVEAPKVHSVKQWKINDIYNDLTTNGGRIYKAHCESNNTLDSEW